MRIPADARLLVLSLLCPLACVAEDFAALDESSSDDGADDDEPFSDDVTLAPRTSETRELDRSRLTVGLGYACSVVGDGTVRCWGSNYWGALGDGTTTDSATPVTVSGLTDVVAIDSGTGSVTALRSHGTVWRWGAREGAGDPPPIDTTPQLVPGLADIIAIGTRWNTTCAVRSDGRVFCWGAGILGDGQGFQSTTTPVQVTGITTAVATNGQCALLSNGTIKCWGFNNDGQLGDGTDTNSNVPVTVTGIGTAVGIDGNLNANYAVLADGTVWSWGGNDGSGLGTGVHYSFSGFDESLVPVQVVGIDDARQVTAGDASWGNFACALLDDGTVRCWGSNSDGQLGLGVADYDQRPSPQPILDLADVVEIAAGADRAQVCAARSDGTLRCWGDNGSGSLGDGTTIDRYSPVDVVGISGANDGPRVATGLFHSCGLRSDGTAKCWGDNSEGQLGDGTQVDRTSATLVAGLANAIDIEAGSDHTCALIDDGTARCWGANASGQLGDDGASGSRSTTPVAVQGLEEATQLAAAEDSTCAILSDGTAACWGSNTFGQLGDGTYNGSDVPVAVSGLTNAVAIDAMRHHVCALGSGGQVKCWGTNANGQLGNGSSGGGVKSNVPVTVRTAGLLHPPLGNVVGITSGSAHSCAVIAGGSLKCWGAGHTGALGHGAWTSSNYPVTVNNISTGIEVSAGTSSSCALRSNGSARCWGSNDYGELGNADDTATNTPVTVGQNPLYLSNAIAIDSGYDHTCVARGNGSIWCWGRNDDGQLGNTTTFDADRPVVVAFFP